MAQLLRPSAAVAFIVKNVVNLTAPHCRPIVSATAVGQFLILWRNIQIASTVKQNGQAYLKNLTKVLKNCFPEI